MLVRPNPGGFGVWAEQLLAESTGKEGKGLVPVPGEAAEGPDRQTAPVLMGEPYDLGIEFFRWEFAVAVAGAIMGINPFDQPNVQEAKDRTQEVLSGHDRGLSPDVATGDMEAVESLLAEAAPPDYVAVQAFIDPAREDGARAACRTSAGDRLRRYRRARAALPSLHRPAPQGRPADRPLRAGRRRPRRGAPHPGPGVRVSSPHPLPGCG